MLELTWPNRITIFRILMIGPFVIALLKLRDPVWAEYARWTAVGVFSAMAVSDGLDGFLARRWRQESMAGRFLDPLADKLLVLCSVVLLAHEGTNVAGILLPPTVAVIAVGKDLIVLFGFCIIYFTTSRIFIEPHRVGKWCTTMQLCMVVAILISPNLPRALAKLPNVLWWTASVLAVLTVVKYFQVGRRFIAHHEQQRANS